jgi:hypothetical protein
LGLSGVPRARPAQRLILTLPNDWRQHSRIRVLADTAFGGTEMLRWVKAQAGLNIVVGVRQDRRLAQPGASVQSLKRQGAQVRLDGLSFSVTLSWYWVKRDDGCREKRFVIATEPLSGSYITRLGRRRWQIEGFFKVIKHRFSLHRFGQATLTGVYRWIVLAFLAYFLAHAACLWSNQTRLPDWGKMARSALEILLPGVIVKTLMLMLRRYQDLAKTQGIAFSIGTCSSA